MFEQLGAVITQLEACVAALDPARLDGAQAAQLVERYVHIERVVAAGRLRAARRVEETKAYARAGHHNAAAWLAEVAGTSTGQAASALHTAQQLAGLSVTADALASGLISEAEARAIASAASVDAKAEADLLATARRDSHRQLQEEAQRRRAAAQGKEDRDERLRANRRLSDWNDADGATCVRLSVAPDDGARLLAAVDARAEQLFQEAYQAGRRERLAAYRADALLSLVDDAVAGSGSGSGSPATGRRGIDTCVTVLIDYTALVRGSTEAGETCEIPGVGPVSVATARRLLSDSVLKLVITDGVDVYNVTHAGRTIPAHLRSALEVRDQVCCRPTCAERRRLEIHHYKANYAEVRRARLDELAGLCRPDHRLVTQGKARLEGGPGRWRWVDLTVGSGPPAAPPPDRGSPADPPCAAQLTLA